MLTAQLSGTVPLQQQLQLLALPEAKRRRLLANVGRQIQSETRANIRQQRDIYGKPFTKRSTTRNKKKRRRKLLAKMGKQLTQRATPQQVTIGFKGKAGEIAYKHHFGDSQRQTAQGYKRQMKQRRKGEGYYDNPATAEQAKVLVRQLGYKRPIKGGKPKRVSQAWIKRNLTIAQAGAIIKAMREEQGLPARSATSWQIVTPSRKFFATTDAEANQIVTKQLAKALQQR